MMKRFNNLALFLTILSHTILIISLFITLEKKDSHSAVITSYIPKKSDHSIQAHTLNQDQIIHEIKKIKEQRLAEERSKQERLERLEKLTTKAEEKRVFAKDELKKLKEEQQKMLVLENQRQTSIDEKRRAEEKDLTDLKNREREALMELEKVKLDLAKIKESQLREKRDLEILEQKKKLLHESVDRFSFTLEEEKKKLTNFREEIMQKEIKKYSTLIKNSIQNNWNLPITPDYKDKPKIKIELGEDGSILDVELLTSSKNEILDRMAIAAVYKSSPFKVPASKELFSRVKTIILTLDPSWRLNL